MDTGGVVTDLGQVEAVGNRLGLGCVGGAAVAERGALKEHSELYFCREEWGRKRTKAFCFTFTTFILSTFCRTQLGVGQKRR